MLYECNVLKLKTLKYGPLIFGILILCGSIPKVIYDNRDKFLDTWPLVFFLVLISATAFVIFFNWKDKLRYVAIGKSKLVVKKSGQEVEDNWLDVESITLNRFFGIYALKLKGEEELYFPAYGRVFWLTGDGSDMGVVINKMKGELQI